MCPIVKGRFKRGRWKHKTWKCRTPWREKFCIYVLKYKVYLIKYHWAYTWKLDSMRWFSHRRSPSPPGGTQWYRLFLRAACCLRRTPYYALSMGMTQQFFVFCPWWPWPLTLTFELNRDFCTVYLTAKFRCRAFPRSEIIVRTNKQTPLKTSTSLRYAIRRRCLCNSCAQFSAHTYEQSCYLLVRFSISVVILCVTVYLC